MPNMGEKRTISDIYELKNSYIHSKISSENLICPIFWLYRSLEYLSRITISNADEASQ